MPPSKKVLSKKVLSKKAFSKEALNQNPIGKHPFGLRLTRAHTALLLWISFVLWSLWLSGIGREPIVNWGGLPQIGEFLTAMGHPALNAAFVKIIAAATVTTFAFAVCGTTLSLIVGLVLGVACSRVWWRICFPGRVGRLCWSTLRGLLAIPRAIHELIWGLLLLNVLGLDAMVGVLAIAIPFGAITAKVFADIIDETPTGPLDALIYSGVHPVIAFLYGLLPQALPNLISYGFYRFECSLRSAAVLGVIGAGGLGYEIFLSLQSLRYEQMWTGFYSLILLNGTVDYGSGWLRRKMGFVSRMELGLKASRSVRKVVQSVEEPVDDTSATLRERPGQTRRPSAWIVCFLMFAAIIFSFAYLDIDWSRWGRAKSLFADFLLQLTPAQVLPNFSCSLLPIALQTVAMSVLGITLAGIFGVIFSFPAAQNFLLPGGLLRTMGEPQRWSTGHFAMLLARLVLLVARAIPAPILALIILYGMFPGLLPGALALAIHNFGILGRLMAEVNENLPDGPVRGLRSLGATPGALIFYGILPANFSRFLAYILYRWEVCLRETVIVGLVGAGGLGRVLTEQLSSFDYSALAATLTVFILLTIAIDALSGWLRTAVR
ncbi:MAG: PhnE/PtxC family ABC transporter permease [Phormidesmis sp.]